MSFQVVFDLKHTSCIHTDSIMIYSLSLFPGDQGGMGAAPGTDQANLVGSLGGPNPAFSGFAPGMGAGGFNPGLMGMGQNLMGGAGMSGSVLGKQCEYCMAIA